MSEYRRWIHHCKSITSPALAAADTDCDNVALAAPSMMGSASVNFDKVNGAANTLFARVVGTPEYTIDWVSSFRDENVNIYWLIDIPTLTNLAYSFVRLGDSASAYYEWRYADSSHVAGKFVVAYANFWEAYVTGSPTLANPTYLCFGAAFDGETNTLADMLMDGIWVDYA